MRVLPAEGSEAAPSEPQIEDIDEEAFKRKIQYISVDDDTTVIRKGILAGVVVGSMLSHGGGLIMMRSRWRYK